MGCEKTHAFLERVETDYKAPFPTVGEETLAGGLSNTIAGRICNHFDLKGGGYTVDGACASFAARSGERMHCLHNGDLDVALAGGVDLSPRSLRVGRLREKRAAFAREEIEDFRSAFLTASGQVKAAGSWFLMRQEDALAQGCRIYAVLRGWGISSDGQGGITRPEAAGQIEAIRRAYRRAGFGSATVSYCEGTAQALRWAMPPSWRC